MATLTGGTALAERPTDAVWLATLPAPLTTVRPAAEAGRPQTLLPAVRAAASVQRIARLAQGELSGLPGAVTDLAVSRDGRHLVAAHYGEDAVSIVDTATLEVAATVSGIAEPYAVVAADRAYLKSALIREDIVVAVDLAAGTPLAAREVGVGAAGLALSPAGDVLYVARSADAVTDIAVIDVESGALRSIPVVRGPEASIDSLRINPAGTRLYAALSTAAGGSLVTVDIRSGRVQTVAVGASIGDVALHRDDRRVFVTVWDDDLGAALRVVDTGRVVGSYALDGQPAGLLVTGAEVLLAHGETVTVLDAASLRTVNRIDLGKPVSCLAVSRDGTRLYVGGFDGTVTALEMRAARAGLPAAS